MKRASIVTNAILAAGIAALSMSGCRAAEATQPSAAQNEISRSAQVERGAYLVKIMGCDDCHTPWIMGPNGPEPDMSRRLMGHPEGMELPEIPAPEGPWVWTAAGTNTAFRGPWGISYTMNLTPDENTGIGIWTEDMFVKTIRTGRHWGVGRPINPPMPWPAYRNASDEDLKAIYAFLRTLEPRHNRIPDYVPPTEAAAAATPEHAVAGS